MAREWLTGSVTFPGLGDQDWAELDFVLFETSQDQSLVALIDASAEKIAELIGPDYRLEPSSDGTARLLVDDRTRFHAEVNASGRLVLTLVPDPEGPL